MDAAAGADALDDLLAEVAAFGEVQGAGLGGLLWEIVGGGGVTDVSAVAGRAGEDAEVVEGFGGDGDRSGGQSIGLNRADGRGVGPEFDAGNDGAVGLEDIDWCGVPSGGLQSEA